jgi:hypothetical protein
VDFAVAPKVAIVGLVYHTVAREIALQAAMRKRYAEVNAFPVTISIYFLYFP